MWLTTTLLLLSPNSYLFAAIMPRIDSAVLFASPVVSRSGSASLPPSSSFLSSSSVAGDKSHSIAKNTITFPSINILADAKLGSITRAFLLSVEKPKLCASPAKSSAQEPSDLHHSGSETDHEPSHIGSRVELPTAEMVHKQRPLGDGGLEEDTGYAPDREDKLEPSHSMRLARRSMASRLRIVSAPLPTRLPLPPSPPPKPYVRRRRDGRQPGQPGSAAVDNMAARPRTNATIAARSSYRPVVGLGLGLPPGHLLAPSPRASSSPSPRRDGSSRMKLLPSRASFLPPKFLRRAA
ncbi:hypothetical protein FIBSPDRAFT_859432, partial [Athelia psychrophila]